MRLLLAATMAIASCAGMAPAWAQNSADRAAAWQLFQEGRDLLAQKRYQEAIAKLQASLDVDPASGTHGSLAICYERLGKLASAWVHYREAETLAQREGNTGRAKVARDQARALEPRLPRLTIQLASAEPIPDLEVRRDGSAVATTLLATAVYVDPGEHELLVTAPGHEPFSTTFVMAEAEARTIEVPVLAPLPAPPSEEAPPPEPAEAPPPEPAVVETTVDTTGGTGADLPGHGQDGRGRRKLGLITGGVGLASVAAGLGFGAAAWSSWNDAFDSGACDRDTLLCSPEGLAQTNSARNRAWLSNALVGVGIAAAAAGAVLYLSAPDAGQESPSASVVPLTSSDALGVALFGAF